jgi:cytochrome c oxidase assembly protein subunit 15
MLTILLAMALWLGDGRRWVRWLGVAAVAGTSFQGLLGGLRVMAGSQGVLWGVRVIADDRLLAKIHGCTAPLFFSLAAALVAITSRAWREAPGPTPVDGGKTLGRLAVAVTILVYLQIVAGAQLRHLVPQEWTYWFASWVWVHVIVAGLVAVGVLWLIPHARRVRRAAPRLARRTRLLAVLALVQVTLGAATWVVNYGWPVWFTQYVWTPEYTVVAGGAMQAVVTTAHVAVASLVLVTGLSLALWRGRLPAEWEIER